MNGEEEIGSGAPVDFDRLDTIVRRLANDERFERVHTQPEFAPDRIVCIYQDGLYPATIETARLKLVWFENGEFSIHYHETHRDSTFDHRWDRHPSTHNADDHVHPGPCAPTPGEDSSHPSAGYAGECPFGDRRATTRILDGVRSAERALVRQPRLCGKRSRNEFDALDDCHDAVSEKSP